MGPHYFILFGSGYAGLGTDWYAGVTHYIQTGRFEGRTDSFDGLEYIASYDDLIAAFSANGVSCPSTA